MYIFLEEYVHVADNMLSYLVNLLNHFSSHQYHNIVSCSLQFHEEYIFQKGKKRDWK